MGQTDGFKLNVWDIGGQKSIRPYWRNYYENTDCLIYVVDSADDQRMEEAALELATLLAEEKLKGVPLLVYANKQDLLNAAEESAISKALQLDAEVGKSPRTYMVQKCSAKSREGLKEGMKWAVQHFANKKK